MLLCKNSSLFTLPVGIFSPTKYAIRIPIRTIPIPIPN